jgi:hypothetical protein
LLKNFIQSISGRWRKNRSRANIVISLLIVPAVIVSLVVGWILVSPVYVAKYYSSGGDLEVFSIVAWAILALLLVLSFVVLRIKNRILLPLLIFTLTLTPVWIACVQQLNYAFMSSHERIVATVESCDNGDPSLCLLNVKEGQVSVFSVERVNSGRRLLIDRRYGLFGYQVIAILSMDADDIPRPSGRVQSVP